MYLTFNSHVYSFDLNRICEFVLKNNNDKAIESQQSLMYALSDDNQSLDLVTKEVKEIKNNGNVDTIKYDLVKQLLDSIMGIGQKRGPFPIFESENVEAYAVAQPELRESEGMFDDITLGEIIAFNTFLNEGFIYTVDKEDSEEE